MQYAAVQCIAGRSPQDLAAHCRFRSQDIERWTARFHEAAVSDLGPRVAELGQLALKWLNFGEPGHPSKLALTLGRTRRECGWEPLLSGWESIWGEELKASLIRGELWPSAASEGQIEGLPAVLRSVGVEEGEAQSALSEALAMMGVEDGPERGRVLQARKEAAERWRRRLTDLMQRYYEAGTREFARIGSGPPNYQEDVFYALGVRPKPEGYAPLSDHDEIVDAAAQALEGYSAVVKDRVQDLLALSGGFLGAQPSDGAKSSPDEAGIIGTDRQEVLTVLEAREKLLEAAQLAAIPPCGHIYVISGAPTSGKTTLLNLARETPSLRPAIIPKYATRRWRGLEDDTQHDPDISDDNFTFTYPYHLNRYGIRAEDITDIVGRGLNAFVVVSPPRVVKEIKRFFGPLAVSLYLHSNRAEEELEEIVAQRRQRMSQDVSDLVPLEEEVRKRIINMRVMRRQYVDNITLYDHVLLNTASKGVLLQQLEGIVAERSASAPNPSATNGRTAIFLLCAPPSSGKGTLSEALRLMGTNYIRNVDKVADRAPRPNDGPEISGLGTWLDRDEKRERRGTIDDLAYDITYVFNETRYGVASRDIWSGVEEGRAQLVVTNIQAIPRFVERFGTLVVPIYLYTTRTRQQIRNYLIETKLLSERAAEARLDQADQVFQDFVDNIAMFQHVLLNTGDVDDLMDQMFNLLEVYSKGR